MKRLLSVILVLSMVLAIAVPAMAAPLGANHQVVEVTNGMNPGTYLVNDTWSENSKNGYASNRLIDPQYSWDKEMEEYVFNPDIFPNLQFHEDGFPLRATYRTVVEHLGEMKYLAKAYPEITNLIYLGHTNGLSKTDNYDFTAHPEYAIPLYALEISSAPGIMDGRPATLHQAGNHGGELDANEMAANLMWYLCTKYGEIDEVTELIDTTRIYIIPYTNADGNMESFRSTNGNRRTNALGVDLNRNWAYRWGSNTGSSSTTNTGRPGGNYRGATPNSEPETTAITGLYRMDNVVSSISGHTSGQIIIFAWAHIDNPENGHPLLYELAKQQTDINGYTAQNGNVMYSQSGEINDYLWGAMRALGYTYEYNASGQTNPYLGLNGDTDDNPGQPYMVASFESPHGGPMEMRASNYINLPDEDLTAELAFFSVEEFHAGYQDLMAGEGTNELDAPGLRMPTIEMLEAELAARPGFVKDKIFMSHHAANVANGKAMVEKLYEEGAKGWIVVNTSNSHRAGNYGVLNLTSDDRYLVEGAPLPIGSLTKGYAANIYDEYLEDPALTITFKATNTDMSSVNNTWSRNKPAFMLNMSYAKEYANQLKGTITDQNGEPISARLDASLEVEGKIMEWGSTATDDSALAPDDEQWKEWHTPAYDVADGEYIWYMLPSKQTEYPDKGWDITASAPGYYTSETRNLKFPVGEEKLDANGQPVIDPLFQQVIEDYDFTLQQAIATDFIFSVSTNPRLDIVVPFTTYAADGTAADLPGVTALVNGEAVAVESLGNGQYTATFNLKDLGIDFIFDCELVIDFDGEDHTPLTISSGYEEGYLDKFQLSTDAFHVMEDGYANITTEFVETIDSNTAILYYTFDTDRFKFADFHPEAGVRVISKEATATGAKVVVMISSYNTQNYGRLAIQAISPLSWGWEPVKAVVEYVVRDDAGEKEIRYAIATTEFSTKPNEDKDWIDGDTNFDGVVDLIDLSNMIDWFGIDSSDARWRDWYSRFDYNNNGSIDIYDISWVAQLIK